MGSLTLASDGENGYKPINPPKVFETFNTENLGKIKQKANWIKRSTCKEGGGSHVCHPI